MSTYEWERGTINIPARQFTALKRAIINELNEAYAYRFEQAKKLHAAMKDTNSGGSVWEAAESMARRLGIRDVENIVNSITTPWNPGRTTRLSAPKKKDFPHIPYTTKTLHNVPYSDLFVTFSDAKTHTITWDVSENNHAVDGAHKSLVGQIVLRHLGRVQWVKGSGGTIIGNDEYNRDNSYEGGGGNYVTMRFGGAEKLSLRY